MGIAVLSAVVDSLETRQAELSEPNVGENGQKSAPSTGTSTPTSSFYAEASDAAMPSRFIATVGREETVRRLRKTFRDIGGLAESVEVLAGDAGNLKAVTESDVVLVWWVPLKRFLPIALLPLTFCTAPSHKWQNLSS